MYKIISIYKKTIKIIKDKSTKKSLSNFDWSYCYYISNVSIVFIRN